MRRVLAITVAAVAALTLAAGCDSDDPVADGTAPSVPLSPSPSATTASPEPSAPSSSPSSSPTATAAPRPKKLKSGAKGAEVVALQNRLTELGYWNGKADGKFGGTTQQAVFALQKAAGVGRDGTVGPKTWKALDSGVRPKARSTSGKVVEIDLKRQLLLLVDNGQIAQIFNTSTGSMDYYEQEGQTYLADTPRGKFRVSRQIDGWRNAPLGLLWRPKYFNGGIAVHGAPSVPPYPASHGCARVSVAAMNWMWKNDALPIKTRVWVY
ncbi:L,D-transpeptidase family protein [Actinoplanes sp. NPDC051861]|uniref:L,D-transpeptidase family protein n=1 Tax=Actinoplanes sp. NPDC051861 TaxID=3155170 RepID=UPI00343D69B6